MTLTCPFCNAVLATANQEHCPRCNELLPQVDRETSLANGSAINPKITLPSPKNEEMQPAWFRIGFFLSCLVSAIILCVGLWVIYNKKKPETVKQQSEKEQKSPFGPATIPPAGLPAIRYLPTNTQAIAAIQINPLIDFAKRSNRDPKQILEEIGLPSQFWEMLSSTGISIDDIDHLALGGEFEQDNAIPNLTFVFIFRNAVDQSRAQEIIKRIDSAKTLKILALTAKFVDSRILVASSNSKKIASQPFELGGKHLSASLQESMDNRQLSPSSWAWLAADSRNWTDVPTIKALAFQSPQSKAFLEKIKPGRALAIGFSLEPEFNLGISVKCDTNETAEALQTYFGKKGVRFPSLIGKEENWVSIESVIQPIDVVKFFEHILDVKKQ